MNRRGSGDEYGERGDGGGVGKAKNLSATFLVRRKRVPATEVGMGHPSRDAIAIDMGPAVIVSWILPQDLLVILIRIIPQDRTQEGILVDSSSRVRQSNRKKAVLSRRESSLARIWRTMDPEQNRSLGHWSARLSVMLQHYANNTNQYYYGTKINDTEAQPILLF
ncbi:hypothetical protein Tco_1430134 [Tanacetum coccineum]